jgi:5-methyltetrahydropteroyltriglutamate--homocysteine methyltransferase
VLAQLQLAQERFGDNLWVSSSCSLLHSPVDLEREDKLDPELKSWLAFAVQKCGEIAVLRDALNDPQAPRVQAALAEVVPFRSAAPSRHASTKPKYRHVSRR